MECESQLRDLNKKVEKLREDFGQKTSQAEILKRDLIKEENILSSAQSLLSKLGDEKVRWEE